MLHSLSDLDDRSNGNYAAEFIRAMQGNVTANDPCHPCLLVCGYVSTEGRPAAPRLSPTASPSSLHSCRRLAQLPERMGWRNKSLMLPHTAEFHETASSHLQRHPQHSRTSSGLRLREKRALILLFLRLLRRRLLLQVEIVLALVAATTARGQTTQRATVRCLAYRSCRGLSVQLPSCL